MPFSTTLVNQQTETIEHNVDARWIMAYAAALGDHQSCYMDTTGDIVAHPVFPVCVEWPVILAIRRLPGMQSLTDAESARGVHAAHDLHLHAPIRAGDTLSTQGRYIGASSIRPGASYVLRLDTRNQHNELVAQTFQTGIYRNVETLGEPVATDDAPAWPAWQQPAADQFTCEFDVPAGLAHTYTECARIWNPIHTDRAVALAAGLPDIILHGTATLALAVSRLVEALTGGDPTRIRRLGGRFSGMVLMPSTLTLRTHQQDHTICFEVLTQQGEPAISQGFVCLD